MFRGSWKDLQEVIPEAQQGKLFLSKHPNSSEATLDGRKVCSGDPLRWRYPMISPEAAVIQWGS